MIKGTPLKRVLFIGIAWLALGVLSFVSSIYRLISLPTLAQYKDNLLPELHETLDVIGTFYPYLIYILIGYILLSVIVIYVSYNLIRIRQWALQSMVKLSIFYLMLSFIYLIFVTYMFYNLTIDTNINFLTSGILSLLARGSLLFVPFVITLFVLKQQKVRSLFCT